LDIEGYWILVTEVISHRERSLRDAP